jgi:hypothetical protein|tara:strand:- start:134 stop:346 length:213 start_codon:yes stop_codon:yes gene_type:complete
MKFSDLQVGEVFAWEDFVRLDVPIGSYGVCEKKSNRNWIEGGKTLSNPDAIRCDVMYLWPMESLLEPGED